MKVTELILLGGWLLTLYGANKLQQENKTLKEQCKKTQELVLEGDKK